MWSLQLFWFEARHSSCTSHWSTWVQECRATTCALIVSFRCVGDACQYCNHNEFTGRSDTLESRPAVLLHCVSRSFVWMSTHDRVHVSRNFTGGTIAVHICLSRSCFQLFSECYIWQARHCQWICGDLPSNSLARFLQTMSWGWMA